MQTLPQEERCATMMEQSTIPQPIPGAICLVQPELQVRFQWQTPAMHWIL